MVNQISDKEFPSLSLAIAIGRRNLHYQPSSGRVLTNQSGSLMPLDGVPPRQGVIFAGLAA
jgi:hypothetical protein